MGQRDDTPDRGGDARIGESAPFRTDWDAEEGPTHAVVHAVAAATGRRPEELRPLYEVVDSDALDRIFRRRHPSQYYRNGRVELRFEGCDVVVDADGRVTAAPID